VFGATVIRESDASLGGPAYLRLGNIWLSINVGGGPTDDKPSEIRCYIRDPDGYLIEVGQTTFTASPLDLYR
jgi:hypothetical protein